MRPKSNLPITNIVYGMQPQRPDRESRPNRRGGRIADLLPAETVAALVERFGTEEKK